MKTLTQTLRFCIILCILTASKHSSAQFWGGLGYNFSIPLGTKNLNYVLDRFNSTRQGSLNKEMKNVNFLSGLSLRVGILKKDRFMDIGYSTSSSMISAKGTLEPMGPEMQRDVKTSFNAIEFCYGHFFLNSEKLTYGFGLNVGIGQLQVKTRTDKPQTITNAFWAYPVKNTMLTLGLISRVMILDPGFTFEPYVNFSILGMARGDAAAVNEKINPLTHAGDKAPLRFNANSIGMRVYLSLSDR